MKPAGFLLPYLKKSKRYFAERKRIPPAAIHETSSMLILLILDFMFPPARSPAGDLDEKNLAI
jgi:hypothetical protein